MEADNRDPGSVNRPGFGAPGSFAEHSYSTPRRLVHCGVLSRDRKTRRTPEAQLTPHSLPELPAELADWPACTLDEAQLGDLELLTTGAFAPLRGFMDAADAAWVAERGLLIDGTPWPVPVTLEVPADAIPADTRHVDSFALR